MQQRDLPRQLRVILKSRMLQLDSVEITYVDAEIENATTGLAKITYVDDKVANVGSQLNNSKIVLGTTDMQIGNTVPIIEGITSISANTVSATELIANTVNATTLSGSLSTGVQPNIRSIGKSTSITTIEGDLNIIGNIIGQTTVTNVTTETVNTSQSIIRLAENNATDSIKFGLYGSYIISSQEYYSGLIRKPGNDTKWLLFENMTSAPEQNLITANGKLELSKLFSDSITGTIETPIQNNITTLSNIENLNIKNHSGFKFINQLNKTISIMVDDNQQENSIITIPNISGTIVLDSNLIAATTGLAKITYVDTEIENATSGLAKITYVNTEIENATAGLAKITDVDTEIENATAGLAKVTYVNTEIENATAGLAKVTYVDTEIENATAGLAEITLR